jgi:hypothetical protein
LLLHVEDKTLQSIKDSLHFAESTFDVQLAKDAVRGGNTFRVRAAYGWPSDIPIDAPMTECNRLIGERIAQFRMRESLPIRVRIDQERMLGSLHISPVNDSENTKLRALRDRLADDVFRFRAPDHDAYGFHVTVAYQLAQLTPGEEKQHQAMMNHYLPAMINANSMELGIPEFCIFRDMYRFEIVALLRT